MAGWAGRPTSASPSARPGRSPIESDTVSRRQAIHERQGCGVSAALRLPRPVLRQVGDRKLVVSQHATPPNDPGSEQHRSAVPEHDPASLSPRELLDELRMAHDATRRVNSTHTIPSPTRLRSSCTDHRAILATTSGERGPGPLEAGRLGLSGCCLCVHRHIVAPAGCVLQSRTTTGTAADEGMGSLPCPIWQECLAKARILRHSLPRPVGVGRQLASACSASLREDEAEGLLLPRQGDDGRHGRVPAVR